MKRICYYCMRETMDGSVCSVCGRADPETTSEILKPGTALKNGEYIVGNSIGRGGFGITYAGEQTNLKSKRAIKEFFPKDFVTRDNNISSSVRCVKTGNHEKDTANYAMFDTEKQKVIKEARILAQCENLDGIVKVYDYFEENNTAYIVMEYLEGDTLQKYINNKGKINAEDAFKMFSEIMKALAELHNRNIVHRDVSPDNIKFDNKRNIWKLLDFGAARQVFFKSTKSVSVMVKHGFSPEEQYRSKGKLGSWSDIYSLCATIYFCITGGEIPESALDRKDTDELKRPSELGANITEQQEKALMYGLNVIVADRCESIGEFVNVWNGGEIKKNNAEMETVRKDDKANIPIHYTHIGGGTDIDPPNSPSREVEPEDDNGGDSTPPKPPKSKLPIVISVISVLTIVAVGVVVFMMNNPFAAPDTPSQISKNTESSEIVSEVTHEEMEVSVISYDDGENKDTSPIEPDESPEIEETSVITPEESKALAIKEYLDRADVLVSKKNYSDAYTLLKNAIERFGSDSSIISKQSEIKQIECKEKIAELESSKSYGEAIVYMNENKSAWENDMDYVEKYSTFVSGYRNSILSEAEKLFNVDDIDGAIKKLNEGLTILESDDVLEEKRNEYETYVPVPLSSIKVVTGEIDRIDDTVSDLLGNQYEPNNLYSVYPDYDEAVLYLRDGYSKLTGTIAKAGRVTGRTFQTLYIYGSDDGTSNNKVLIDSIKLYDTSEPINISFDISDYKYIHFGASYGGYFYLINFQFWK